VLSLPVPAPINRYARPLHRSGVNGSSRMRLPVAAAKHWRWRPPSALARLAGTSARSFGRSSARSRPWHVRHGQDRIAHPVSDRSVAVEPTCSCRVQLIDWMMRLRSGWSARRIDDCRIGRGPDARHLDDAGCAIHFNLGSYRIVGGHGLVARIADAAPRRPSPFSPGSTRRPWPRPRSRRARARP